MIRALALLALLASPALAQDFSEGSEADSWGLAGERKARFEARVVDAVCALTGDCPEDCGGGSRQMALIRAADDVMVMTLKNAQPIFSGATVDLAPFCGRDVTVDGLLVGEPETVGDAQLMQIQIVVDGEETVRANKWLDAWRAAHPDAAAKGGEWFRNDPAIQAEIAEEGYTGLGQAADAEYAEEFY
ncbi:MAG: hypothetical protein ACFBWO_08085 [Paracoccaceae bacterium]